MYSPYDTNVYGSTSGSFRGQGGFGGGVKSCEIVFVWGHFLFTCSETYAVGCIV